MRNDPFDVHAGRFEQRGKQFVRQVRWEIGEDVAHVIVFQHVLQTDEDELLILGELFKMELELFIVTYDCKKKKLTE